LVFPPARGGELALCFNLVQTSSIQFKSVQISSNQHVTCFNEEALNLVIYVRIDHLLGPVPIRAGQPGVVPNKRQINGRSA